MVVMVTVMVVMGRGKGRYGNDDEQKNSSEKFFHGPKCNTKRVSCLMTRVSPHQNRNGKFVAEVG